MDRQIDLLSPPRVLPVKGLVLANVRAMMPTVVCLVDLCLIKLQYSGFRGHLNARHALSAVSFRGT